MCNRRTIRKRLKRQKKKGGKLPVNLVKLAKIAISPARQYIYRCAARLESDLRFLRSRYCSNHVNPKRSCPLREHLTHSTSCSVVQDGVSFVELNGVHQQVTCCQSLEQAAGCLVVCYSIGNYGEAILRIETHRRVRTERIGVGDP